jgi:predicted nicotinamide N-methyase
MPITSVPSSHQISYMGVQALKSSHPQVRKLKRQQQGHSAHGNKVWRSSFVLMDYLSDQAIPQHSRVLDIGCGWGLTAIYLAKQFNANVTGIDIDASVEPFLTLQAEINDCQISFQRRSFESLTKSELAKYHSLIGTDICFWDELTVPLFNLIRRAISAGCQNIYIADPGRPPFWELADQCVEKLGAEVISRSIDQPWKTEKYILVIEP